MRSGNRGRKIEHAKAVKAFCQITLIVGGYGHSQGSPSAAALWSLKRGETLNCEALTWKTGRPDRTATLAFYFERKLDPFLHSFTQGWNEDAF
jgi:hypothetical protein